MKYNKFQFHYTTSYHTLFINLKPKTRHQGRITQLLLANMVHMIPFYIIKNLLLIIILYILCIDFLLLESCLIKIRLKIYAYTGEIMLYCVVSSSAIFQPVLMHDPIRFFTVWSSTFVENQSLSHTNTIVVAIDHLVTACGLPEPRCSGSICSSPCWVFLVFMTEEIPVILCP